MAGLIFALVVVAKKSVWAVWPAMIFLLTGLCLAAMAALDRVRPRARSEAFGTRGRVESSTPEPSIMEAAHKGPAGSTPWALVTVLAVNVVLFALETLWGGSESTLTLYRMGANLGRDGLVHEPWRIVSSAFLHIGVLHLLFNMWALLAFGQMLEGALGARRFIALYALCAAAGGLTSSLVHKEELAAGASGAVWGLMTGQIALVLRLRRELGAERVPVDTGKLAQPLVVNLLYSLQPGIDMAAHIGGGLAGAGLILSGLISRRQPESAAWRPIAWGAALTMVGSVAMALGHGRPWELLWPPPLVGSAITDTPVAVAVPRGLQQVPSSIKNARVFGDLGYDPLALYFVVNRLEASIAERSRPEVLSEMARQQATQPLEKNQSWVQQPRVVQLRLRPAVFSASSFRDAGRMQTWLIVEGSWLLRFDAVLRPDAPASWTKLPAAIAEGITIHSSEAEAPSTDAVSLKAVQEFNVNEEYGTLRFRGKIRRSDFGTYFEYGVQLQVVFNAAGDVNRVTAIRLIQADLVATRRRDNGERPDILYRDKKRVSLSLTKDGETKELTDLAFHVTKTVADQATHVGLGLTDGRLFWPVSTELK